MKRHLICMGIFALLVFCGLSGCADLGDSAGTASPSPSVSVTDDGHTNDSTVVTSPSPDADDTQSSHAHSYFDATCTQPKTCSVCGATDGQAAGHVWKDATCTTPKACSVCGEAEGEASGHTWKGATCSQPKTCSRCGETEGQAAGHTWKDATCTQPKTCSVCGTTSGLTAGHDFEDGSCLFCGKADPDYNHETMVWIPTNGGTKYHSKSSCSNMKNPEQVTQSEAEERGFTPCKKCY